MKIIGILFLVLVVAGGIWYFMNLGDRMVSAPAPVPMPAPAAVNPPPPPQAMVHATHVVNMTSSGFSPKELIIKAGDSVEFINKDTRNWWPASGVHPTHQICPGFDSLKGLKPGETYSHTFSEAKECPMHDHLKANMFGKITVTQ